VLARIKEYSIIFPSIMILCFPVVYVFFKLGFSPVTVTAVLLVSYIILGVIVLPILIVRIAKYNFRDIINLFKICGVVSIASLPVPILCNYYFSGHGIFIKFITTGIACVISVGFSAWFVGVNREEKLKIKSLVKTKFSHH
jgi:hypothetical protein